MIQTSEAGDGTKPYMEVVGSKLEINANQMMKEFILGSDTDRLWDEEVRRLLTSLNVEYEEL